MDSGIEDSDAPEALPPPTDAGSQPEFPLEQILQATPELYARATDHIEGPVWRDGEVFFADDGLRGGLMRVDAERQLFRYFPNLRPVGALALADGSLVVCEKTYLLVRITPQGQVSVLADGPAEFCNDVTVDAQGNIYFSDYRESVFRLTPDGTVNRVVTGLSRPNGIEVDIQSRYLYIISANELYRAELVAGELPGSADLVMTLPGGGDGCAFDEWGHLWIAIYGTGRIAVVDPEARSVRATVGSGAPSRVTNLVFGGSERDVLFTTVGSSGVWRIPVGARGFAGHPGAPQYEIRRSLTISPANTPLGNAI